MKLDEYAIDDLHQCALAEFENDADAQRLLNAKYEALLSSYIELLKSLREKASAASS
jgi:hypothetical protein